LQPIGQQDGVFQRLIIDVLAGLPKSSKGNIKILSVIDAFSGYTFFRPIPNEQTSTIVDQLLEIFAITSYPRVLQSDNAANLTSKIMKSLCEALRITKITFSPYRSQTNGKVERLNQTCMQLIRTALVGKETVEWEPYATSAQIAINASKGLHNLSPFEIINGRQFNFECDSSLVVYHGDAQLDDADDYVRELRTRLKIICDFVTKSGESIDETSKKRYDEKFARPPNYEIGQLFWLKQSSITIGENRKLFQKFSGPFYIVKLLSSHNVILVNAMNGRKMDNKVHVDRIKPAYIDAETRVKMKIIKLKKYKTLR
jgi:hypothetical protein